MSTYEELMDEERMELLMTERERFKRKRRKQFNAALRKLHKRERQRDPLRKLSAEARAAMKRRRQEEMARDQKRLQEEE